MPTTVRWRSPSWDPTISSSAAIPPSSTNPQFALASLKTTNVGGIPAACVGDCGGDGLVTVDELIVLVNISIDNAPASSCEAGHQDGPVAIDEIVSAVNAALSAC